MKDEREVIEIFENFGEKFLEEEKVNKKAKNVRKLIVKLLLPVKNKRILDAGCGIGLVSKNFLKFNPKEIYCLDISKKMIETAKREIRSKKVKFFVDDMEKVKFPDNFFDIIVCNFSLHFKRKIRTTFKNFYRMVKQKGKILIAIPHPYRRTAKYSKNYFKFKKVWIIDKRMKRFFYTWKVEDYINIPIKIGFKLKEIREVESEKIGKVIYPLYLILLFEK